MTITKQVLNMLKCECVLVPFLVAHAHWYKGPVIMHSKRPVIMFSNINKYLHILSCFTKVVYRLLVKVDAQQEVAPGTAFHIQCIAFFINRGAVL